MEDDYRPDGTKLLKGYNHIIDDGDCTDHGYFIPKQQISEAQRKHSEPEAVFHSVPREELLNALEQASAKQTSLLKKNIFLNNILMNQQ